jgi:fatty acid desaturase
MSQVALSPASPPVGEFSLSEARRIVGEHFTPNPWIYWPDLLVSWGIGIACFQLVDFPHWVTADIAWHWPIRIVCFFISSLLIYRCSLFIHELVHIRAGEFTTFRFVWNMLCGIPFLIPTFVYYTHLDHHRRKHYGTEEDGEYIALARLPAWQILLYLSQIFFVPMLVIFRFGVLTPLTWISPTIRNWVHRHLSSMIMDPTYIRPLPTQKTLRIIRLQEAMVFLFIGFMALRTFWAGGLLFKEPLPLSFLPHVYLTGVFVMAINALRTLGAHRWTHLGDREMTFVEQMLDSVDYPNHPLIGGLWAPIGLRFHALHHIFPTMPYHALPEAHRRLMKELPADSPYRQCQADSLHEVLVTLWRRARENKKQTTDQDPINNSRAA